MGGDWVAGVGGVGDGVVDGRRQGWVEMGRGG